MKTAVAALVIGMIGIVGGLIVVSTFINVIVLSALWGWFVTPLFGMAVPAWPALVGLTLIVTWFTADTITYKNHEIDRNAVGSQFVIRPLLVLLVGRIAAGFLGTA